jgi:hypothetical protein
MTANVQLSEGSQRSETGGVLRKYGFMSSLLSELSSIHILRSPRMCRTDQAFPMVDMSVHDKKETLIIAQRTIDNVICDLKMTLDRLMFDEGIDLLKELVGRRLFTFPYRRVQIRANCCQILPVDDDTIVVDTPVIPGVDRRMRYSPLYISRNTSIKAGFTLSDSYSVSILKRPKADSRTSWTYPCPCPANVRVVRPHCLDAKL